MKRILITGGTGFVGRHVEKLLKEEGYEIISICHKKEDFTANHSIFGSIENEDFVYEICKIPALLNIYAIVHMAADINMNLDEEGLNTNIKGTENLCELARRLKVPHFVFLSSIPVIGQPEEIPITEEHKANPLTLYHDSKLKGEECVLELNEEFHGEEDRSQISATVLRIASPIGSGKVKKTFPDIMLQKCKNNEDIELLGKGERVQNYIDVVDIGRAILCALNSENSGLYLVPGHDSVSNRDLVDICKKVTGSDSRVSFKGEDPAESQKWIISGEKIKKDLGYEPGVSIEESLKNEVAK